MDRHKAQRAHGRGTRRSRWSLLVNVERDPLNTQEEEEEEEEVVVVVVLTRENRGGSAQGNASLS